jgi:hypothetical protein
MMTTKITIERTSPHTVRVTLAADVQISGSTGLLSAREAAISAHLIRTGQLRSIKIGKLRRVSRAWIAELIEQLETGSINRGR